MTGSRSHRSLSPRTRRDFPPHAARDAGVTYCIEPLARNQTAFVNTVEEAAAIAGRVGHSHLRTMIDCSAAGQAEAEPVDALVRRWLPTGLIAHMHFNDPNRH